MRPRWSISVSISASRNRMRPPENGDHLIVGVVVLLKTITTWSPRRSARAPWVGRWSSAQYVHSHRPPPSQDWHRDYTFLHGITQGGGKPASQRHTTSAPVANALSAATIRACRQHPRQEDAACCMPAILPHRMSCGCTQEGRTRNHQTACGALDAVQQIATAVERRSASRVGSRCDRRLRRARRAASDTRPTAASGQRVFRIDRLGNPGSIPVHQAG